MPSKFEFLKVAELDLLTDKIECNGIKNNWKVFFRVSGDTEKKIRVFTFRISKPLVPPEITEDDVDFSLIGNENSKVKGFAFDFSYVTYSSSSGN
jgi:hypothetical protein